jgi:hypothetical protein
MAKLQGTEYYVIPNGYGSDGKMDDLQNQGGEEPLWQRNIEEGWNDKQIKSILEEFSEIL